MTKTVVITGASSGIGEALAYAAAFKQYNIVIAARSADKLLAVKTNCDTIGGLTHIVVCDVSNKADCERLIKETIRQFGQLDLLINKAGISMRAVFADCDLFSFLELRSWRGFHRK